MPVYCIYGLSVESNLDLSDVDAGHPGICDMRLHVSFAEMPPVQPIRILESEQWLTIELFPFAVYRLSRHSNDVFCQAADYESFYSTFFNLPFSVFLVQRGDLLLHASSLVHSQTGELLAFAGQKGVGKSTLVQLLCGETYQIYADDTLRIPMDTSMGFRGNSLLKITPETSALIQGRLQLTGHQNAVGKNYAAIPTDSRQRQIRAIVQLAQTSDASFSIRPVNTPLQRTQIICRHLTGIPFWTASMIQKVMQLVKSVEIPVYSMRIPDSLHWLEQQTPDIRSALEQVTNEIP